MLVQKTGAERWFMTSETEHDAWNAGDNYEVYMGRWSRKIATRFLDWLDPTDNLDWIDVACGTGALSSTILDKCNPRSLVGIEQSAGFFATARQNVGSSHER